MKININPIFAFLYASFKCSRVCVCVGLRQLCIFTNFYSTRILYVRVYVRALLFLLLFLYLHLFTSAQHGKWWKDFYLKCFFRLFIDCLTNRGWTHFESRCAIKTVWTHKTCVGYEKKTMWKKNVSQKFDHFSQYSIGYGSYNSRYGS